jgi:hypothetical protein
VLRPITVHVIQSQLLEVRLAAVHAPCPAVGFEGSELKLPTPVAGALARALALSFWEGGAPLAEVFTLVVQIGGAPPAEVAASA